MAEGPCRGQLRAWQDLGRGQGPRSGRGQGRILVILDLRGRNLRVRGQNLRVRGQNLRVRDQIFGPRGQNLRVRGRFWPFWVPWGSNLGQFLVEILAYGGRWHQARQPLLDLSKTWLFARTLSFNSGQGPDRFDRFRSILVNFGQFWAILARF